jgi:Tol biopolymer transport system component
MWTPDGQRIIARTAAGLTVYDADGSGRSQVIPGTADIDYPASMAADGDTLITQRSTQETSFDIFTLSLRNPSNVQPLVRTPAYEGGARMSPDGKWLLYVSNESGQNEIYVVPFPNTAVTRWQASQGGGTEPLWSHSGKELFYRDAAGNMVAVAVRSAPTFSVLRAKVLFPAGDYLSLERGVEYAVAPDDQRFLMIRRIPGGVPDEMIRVDNWFEELKQRRRK